jgi:hypothetical protein
MKKIKITFTDGTSEVIEDYYGYETKNEILIIITNYHTRDKIIYPLCSIKKLR